MAIIKKPQNALHATHCLFDMDGLLLNTEDIYTLATSQILARFGQKYDWTLKSRIMGMREDEAAELLVKELGIALTAEQYLAERNALHKSLFPQCVPLPGVIKLVQHLNRLGVPMAVATSSHRGAFVLKTTHNAELFDLFAGNITTGDDSHIKRGKPAPDLFLAAQEQLQKRITANAMVEQLCADNGVVFEDAPSGVLAGLNAGMSVVWVRDPRLSASLGHSHEHQMLVQKCFAVVENMEEFDPAWIDRPFTDGKT